MREIYNMTDSPPAEYFVFNSPDSPDTLIPGTNSNSDSSQTVTPTIQLTPTTDFTVQVYGEPQSLQSTANKAVSSPYNQQQCLPKALTLSQANELLKCFQTSCVTGQSPNKATSSQDSTRLSLTNLLPSRSDLILFLIQCKTYTCSGIGFKSFRNFCSYHDHPQTIFGMFVTVRACASQSLNY